MKPIRTFLARVNAVMRLRRRVRRAERRLRKIEQEKDSTIKQLTEAIDTLEIASANAQAALTAAAQQHTRNEELTNELRAELKVATDIEIPTLVASHILIKETIEAETAAQTRRIVAAQITESE